MSNNIALQIAIGLVFTYLLYSLLATTLKEFVASFFAYRERMLERGIEQMLDGRNYSYYWWDKAGNWFNWAFRYQKTFTRQEFFERKTLDPEKLDKKMPRGKLDEKAALFSTCIFQHPLYKRAAINNRLSKKPAYLSSDTFSDILIDVLSAHRSGGTTTVVLLKDISGGIDHHCVGNAELKKILHIYLKQANGDLQRFKLLIENWYDDTMDRVSGWYKRQAARILFTIGLFMALSFNVDTINIVHTLSVDPAQRAAFDTQAANYVNSHTTLPATSDNKALADNYQQVSALYNKTLLKGDSLFALGWGKYGGHTSISGKVLYIAGATFCPFCPDFRWSRLVGFILTALAISLGAPFWFDLLNKFINLRISGQKPDDSRTAGSKTAGLNQLPGNIPNPKAFG